MSLYPPHLTEVERVELASALSFHFDECPTDERTDQFDIVCAVVARILRRRSGGVA